MSQTVERKYKKDGIEYCYCSKHNEFEPCSKFSPRESLHGFYYYCRECMMKYQRQLREKKIRYKIEDGVELCFCSQHDQFHPCDEFQRSKAAHGYQYNCRVITKLHGENRGIEFSKNQERIQAIEILKLLGYDTESEIPVHKQFEKKHDL